MMRLCSGAECSEDRKSATEMPFVHGIHPVALSFSRKRELMVFAF